MPQASLISQQDFSNNNIKIIKRPLETGPQKTFSMLNVGLSDYIFCRISGGGKREFRIKLSLYNFVERERNTQEKERRKREEERRGRGTFQSVNLFDTQLSFYWISTSSGLQFYILLVISNIFNQLLQVPQSVCRRSPHTLCQPSLFSHSYAVSQ